MKKEKVVFYVLALVLFLCIILCCSKGVTNLKKAFAENVERTRKADIGLGYTPPPEENEKMKKETE